MTPGTKLTRKQEAAILALLTSRTVEEAARVARVGPRTLYRWKKEREFDAAYREAKRAAFSQSIARLHQMSTAAVTTLGNVMIDSVVAALERGPRCFAASFASPPRSRSVAPGRRNRPNGSP